MIGTDPATAFILVIVIGVAAGMVFDRFHGPSWLARQFGAQRSSATTSLVGVAGAFIGYHLGLMGQMIGLGAYIGFTGAALGAAIILWLWRHLP
ncbi:MAG TPA: transglycosylase [Xanthobacteraceae bacterium]|jgi:uncharacterized membrane protein YeaQ/YmgE (transglycosylase-associated protein family)|nr:transglycosylase [Xanthobacteraceae bacterium]